MKLAVKLLVKHKKGCNASRAWPENPWWIPGTAIWRDFLGRKGRQTYRWLVLECNSTDCNAQAIVRDESITQVAQAALEAAS